MPDNTTTPHHKAGFVNIVGMPNVGKSTLMNFLVGEQLAIVTNKAQTTRQRLLGIVNGPDFQIVYSDTPGLLEPKYKMQDAMLGYIQTALDDADIVLLIADITNQTSAENYQSLIRKVKVPVLLLLNKIDLLTPEKVELALQFWQQNVKAQLYLPVSAITGQGLQQLQNQLIGLLPASPPYYDKDELTNRPYRFFVAEIIREKILLTYAQEIPYSVEVVIEKYTEEPNIVRIEAQIWCNRKSQKPIIIGAGGKMLKKVGTLARKDIEAFIGRQIFLGIQVKVRENWRDDELTLKNLGYIS
ncbi:MAG: GTPase Era [Chitinophagales bacterium]|nr:GTPase Era [Chitinophagales bacterium]MCC7057013.1 GTPase Era [Chitinophagales bacterium]MDA0197892.1 GTPase Era [Bacteroidota bacterium]HMS50772.1 GTPase Era [Chitinophagales bacterium]